MLFVRLMFHLVFIVYNFNNFKQYVFFPLFLAFSALLVWRQEKNPACKN